MSDLVKIEAQVRETKGKNACRKIRKGGLVPANLQGKAQSEMIQLDPKWISKAWKMDRKFILDFKGSAKEVTIKEIHFHPVSRKLLHIDLMYS